MRSRRRALVRSLLCVLLLAPAGAWGATLYSAEAFAFGGAFDIHSGPAPVSATTSNRVQTPTSQQRADASATAGLWLGAATSASAGYINDPPCCSFAADATAFARFSGYDVILSGPSGDSTTTSLDLIFDGTAAVTRSGDGGVDVEASMSGPSGSFTDVGSISTRIAGQAPTGSGILAAWMPGPLAVTTSSLLVSAGDMVTIGLALRSTASCSTDPQVVAASCGSSSRARSYSFPFSGPVFNLPAGWTADSLDGTIVNNMIVPEPATALLLLGGIIRIARSRHRGGRGTPQDRRW